MMKSPSSKSGSPLFGQDDLSTNTARRGVLFGLAAYSIWGAFPLFFKALAGASALEIVCHRISWSTAFLLILVVGCRQLGNLMTVFSDRSVMVTLFGSTFVIATNWLVFIFAIHRGEILQSSLAYFITPLLSVLLGFVFFRERLSFSQKISVLFALIGVLNLTYHQGQIPWIALILATTFGFYGLLRKLAKVDAIIGLTIETVILAPLALGYLIYLSATQEGAFLTGSLQLDLLLPLSGVITAVPLLLFAGAARRLPLTTIGFLQYITPNLHFALAVGLYQETFSQSHLVSFMFIWAGLGIYSADTIWKTRATFRKTELHQ